MNKLRISLTEKDGEVKGKIEADGDSLFVFECLLEIIETRRPRKGPGPEANKARRRNGNSLPAHDRRPA